MQQIRKAIGKFLAQQKLFFFQKKQGNFMPIGRGTAWVVLFPWFKSCGDQNSTPIVPTSTAPAATSATPAQTTTLPSATITPPAKPSSEKDTLPSGEAPPAQSTDSDFSPSAPPPPEAYETQPPYNPAYPPSAPLEDLGPPPSYEEYEGANNQQNSPPYDAGKANSQHDVDEKKFPEPEVTTKADAKKQASIHFKFVEDTLKKCASLERELYKLVNKTEAKTLALQIMTFAQQLHGYYKSIDQSCLKIYSYIATAKRRGSKTEADKLFNKTTKIHESVVVKNNEMMSRLRTQGIIP